MHIQYCIVVRWKRYGSSESSAFVIRGVTVTSFCLYIIVTAMLEVYYAVAVQRRKLYLRMLDHQFFSG